MQIVVKTVVGKDIALEVECNDTVNSIKRKIHEKEGIRPEEQALIFGGRGLTDGGFLGDYGIQDESILNLVFRLPGSCVAVNGREESRVRRVLNSWLRRWRR